MLKNEFGRVSVSQDSIPRNDGGGEVFIGVGVG